MFEDIIGKKKNKTAKEMQYTLEIYDNGVFRSSKEFISSSFTSFNDFVDSVDRQCETEKQQGKLNDYTISVNGDEKKIKVDVHLRV